MNWVDIAECAASLFIVGSIAAAVWGFGKYLRS
jgi:hypothetical protein